MRIILVTLPLSVLATAAFNFALWGYVLSRPELERFGQDFGSVTHAVQIELQRGRVSITHVSRLLRERMSCGHEDCQASASWLGKNKQNYYCGAACLGVEQSDDSKPMSVIEDASGLASRICVVLSGLRRYSGIEQLARFPKGDDVQMWLYSNGVPHSLSARYLVAVDYQVDASDDDRRAIVVAVIEEHGDRTLKVRDSAGYRYDTAGIEFVEWPVLFPLCAVAILLVLVVGELVSSRRSSAI